MNLKALRAGSHCVGDELCRGGDTAAGGESCRTGFFYRWRISERMLFLVSILGGSIGTWAGMYVFHHKTRHWYFVIGIPLILILQIAGAIWLYRQGLYHL